MTTALVPQQLEPLDVSGATDDDQFVNLWLSRYESARTRRTYDLAIRKFRSYFRDGMKRATVKEAIEFAEWLNRGRPASKRITLAACSALWQFGERTGYLRANIFRLAGIKVEVDRTPKRIEESEVQAIIDSAPAGYGLLFEVLYYGGLRIDEALRLTWADITTRPALDDATRRVIVLGDLAVMGKGHKRRTVTIPEEQTKKLLAVRQPAGPMFASARYPGRPRSYSSVLAAIREAARRAGVTKPVSPHWLRAGHVTHSAENGADLHVIRDTVGHKSIATTNVYLHSKPGASSSAALKQRKG